MEPELAGELRIILGQLNRRLRNGGSSQDLTQSQKYVLVRLEREGPSTASALALAEGMRPQSMGAIVAALEAAGFVSGAPDPADGRRTILSATDAARREVAARRLAKEDYLADAIAANLTADEQKQLASAVALMKRLI
jgi:DNA-binding MarR family transcriptional regulator